MTDKGNRNRGAKIGRLAALLLLLSLLPACSTARFYGQILQGQGELMRRARPVSAVLADPAAKPRLKDKLRTTRDLLAFARSELHLPARGQYERYSDLGRRYSVWVVFAAPEFSLEAHTWWYPLIGSLKYRGYFRESLAEQEAARLRARGLDVFVGGVEAYSTLGWLRDPLLNTFIGRPDAELAELLFHELTHQRLYLPGDTDFNEALATAVGREGARRWLRARGRQAELAEYERDLRTEHALVGEVLRSRAELQALYARRDLDEAARRQGKQAAFDRLRQRLQALNRRQAGALALDRWFAKPVNNARLNTLAAYHDLVPGFEALLRRHGGDLPAFYRAVAALRWQPAEQRRAFLHRLAAQP